MVPAEAAPSRAIGWATRPCGGCAESICVLMYLAGYGGLPRSTENRSGAGPCGLVQGQQVSPGQSCILATEAQRSLDGRPALPGEGMWEQLVEPQAPPDSPRPHGSLGMPVVCTSWLGETCSAAWECPGCGWPGVPIGANSSPKGKACRKPRGADSEGCLRVWVLQASE